MDPRFPAGLPFPVLEILEFVAFRDAGKIFPLDFSGVFLENPRADPGNSHSLLEFSEIRKINNVQSRCFVKGEAQKSPLFWGFLIFSVAPVL